MTGCCTRFSATRTISMRSCRISKSFWTLLDAETWLLSSAPSPLLCVDWAVMRAVIFFIAQDCHNRHSASYRMCTLRQLGRSGRQVGGYDVELPVYQAFIRCIVPSVSTARVDLLLCAMACTGCGIENKMLKVNEAQFVCQWEGRCCFVMRACSYIPLYAAGHGCRQDSYHTYEGCIFRHNVICL